MKFIITENQISELIDQYINNNLLNGIDYDVTHKYVNSQPAVSWFFPNNYGDSEMVMYLSHEKSLMVSDIYVEKLATFFSLTETETLNYFMKWVIDTYSLQVNHVSLFSS